MSDKNLNILVVDDNEEIHEDFIKILTKPNARNSKLSELELKLFGKSSDGSCDELPSFYIETSSHGQEGYNKIKSHLEKGVRFALAFVDIRMPSGWDGIETIKHLWELDPDIQVVICTAYSDYSWEETVQKLGNKDNLLILKKPFDVIAVRQLAAALTRKWQLLYESRKYAKTLEDKISERTSMLEQSLSLVKATLESSNNGILVVDLNSSIIDYNLNFISLWGIVNKPQIGTSIRDLLKYMDSQCIHPNEVTMLFENDKLNIDDVIVSRLNLVDGRVLECSIHPQVVNNSIVGKVVDFNNITERLTIEKKLEYQALHDPLTGAPNRVKLISHIDVLIVKSKGASQFAVLFLDLDRFKLINDSLSHDVGDEVLRMLSVRLNSVISDIDFIARLGGDEFVVVISNFQDKDDLKNKISIIFDCFSMPFQIGDRNLVIASSIGVSVYPEDGTTVDVLLKNADIAMYRAKKTRGNSFQFFTSELGEQCLADLDNEVDLRHAIINNQLFLCFQPQVDLLNHRVVAFEALVRWRHPTRGVLLPIDFIPLAEETGLILQVGEFVLRQSCLSAAAWSKMTSDKIRVAVNVSPQQITYSKFVDLIKDALASSGLDPSLLEIELTENAIISSPEVLNVLNAVKEMGVTIAIDDFGTGYSNFSYLKRIPLKRLKIDASFVQHINNSSDDELIIQAIIAMAHHMKLDVLAEGVENTQQLSFLKSHHCDNVQGYFVSKPLEFDQIKNLIQSNELTVEMLRKNDQEVLSD